MNTVNVINNFKIFSGLPVVAAFSDRSVDLGYEAPFFENNRRKFLEELGIDYAGLVCARQAHGTKIIEAGAGDKGKVFYGADAFITEEKNAALSVFTADCLSVFIYDKINKALGLAHAGWRGSKEGIALKTLRLMRQRFKTKPQNLLCAFGPAIRSCCYEVGEEFGGYFSSGLISRDNKLYLDLAEVNKKQLLSFGLKDSQIEDSKICTSCSTNRFFSFRREKDDCGRLMSVMMLM